MKLYTSYFAHCKSGDNCISISQGVPDGYSGRRSLVLAPSWELVMKLKNGQITIEEYTTQYLAQLNALGIDAVLTELREGDIMLCWEGKNKFCHRHILASWLNEHGHDVTELE